MLINCNVIVVTTIYGQFGAISNPDAWSVKLIFSLTATIYLTKSENRIKKSQHGSHSITLSKGPVFTKKC